MDSKMHPPSQIFAEQASKDLIYSTTVHDETFVLEPLIPVKYKKANLEQVTHCVDWTPKQQLKLLHNIQSHDALSLSKQVDWKG